MKINEIKGIVYKVEKYFSTNYIKFNNCLWFSCAQPMS